MPKLLCAAYLHILEPNANAMSEADFPSNGPALIWGLTGSASGS